MEQVNFKVVGLYDFVGFSGRHNENVLLASRSDDYIYELTDDRLVVLIGGLRGERIDLALGEWELKPIVDNGNLLEDDMSEYVNVLDAGFLSK